MITVDEAILSRRSVRAFLPDPVEEETLRHILSVASRAPSGTNMQPWKAYAVAGAVKQAITDDVLAGLADRSMTWEQEYKYYPDQFRDPYLSRRRKVGWDMYGLVGIEKGDNEKMAAQMARNFTFFDAPAGIFFTIDKDLEMGSWLDHGMFLENVVLAVRGQDLHSCAQAAWCRFHPVLRKHLGIPEGETVVCGMAIGKADDSMPINTLITDRAPLEEWASFSGFDG